MQHDVNLAKCGKACTDSCDNTQVGADVHAEVATSLTGETSGSVTWIIAFGVGC